MKIYGSANVYDKAIERIEYLFDEFPNIIVSFSGGKDSTVILNLCLEVAKRRKRLPLNVIFIDQEAEWQSTIDYVDRVMHKKGINPLWFQMPIKILNATSHSNKWLMCWNPEDEKNWMRPKSELAITENVFGTDRFHDLFAAIIKVLFNSTKTAYIAGVRTEESPTRFLALTDCAKYKHITYGKTLNKRLEHYTFYPLYDWSYSDIWKYIFDHKCDYNKVYDEYYRYGIPAQKMRVSNLHHETSVHSLFLLQEIEPATWEKISARLDGINTAAHFGAKDFYSYDLPYMFKDWKEYRDYLLDKLISINTDKVIYKKKFDQVDKKYDGLSCYELMNRACVNTLILNDFEFTTLGNRERDPVNYDIVKKAGRGHFGKKEI